MTRKKKNKKIIPAILTNNISDLQNKLKIIEGLTDWVQVDIVDGAFAPAKTIALSKLIGLDASLNIEADLMVLNPENQFDLAKRAKIKRVLFHIEVPNPQRVLKKSQKYSFETGIAINPETPLKTIKPYLSKIKTVLLLGVNPGFQRQKFILSVLTKIKELKRMVPEITVEVDGGIKQKNARRIARAGADNLVVGSALFSSNNFKTLLEKFKQEING